MQRTATISKKELGYVTLERDWKDGDVVEMNLDMEVEVVEADPRVKENVGKRAIQRDHWSIV